MIHFRKKTVLPIAAVIVFLLLAEVIYQADKSSLKTTYSLTLNDLIHANGETNGESSGGDGTDGETGGTGGTGGSTGGSEDGALFGQKSEQTCPAKYDKIETTTTTVKFSVKQKTGIAVKINKFLKYVLSGGVQVESDGKIEWEYTKTVTKTIQTHRVKCEGFWGFCFEKSCGE